MDERFRGRGIWVAAGGLAIIFLCLMLCAMGAMATMFLRQGPAYGVVPQIQAPAGEDGGVAPPITYGPVVGRPAGYGPFGLIGAGIGLLFRLAFFGLLLLLLLGLVRRLFWGPRHWHHRHPGKPPKGKPYPGWGPWAWHCHGEVGDEEAKPASTEGEPDDPDLAYGGAE